MTSTNTSASYSSSSSSTTQPATSKFQQDFVSLLSQTSPSFAALHAIRIRKQQLRDNTDNNSLSSSTLQCSHCGYLGLCLRVQSKSSQKRTRKGQRPLSKPHASGVGSTAKSQNDVGVQKRKRERRIRTTCPACTRVTVQACPTSQVRDQYLSEASNILPTPPAGINVVAADGGQLPSGSSEDRMQEKASIAANIPSVISHSPAPESNALHYSPSPAPSQTPPKTSSSHLDPPKSSKRPRKKTGLADMIARSKAQNRDRNQPTNESSSGLAVFLSGL